MDKKEFESLYALNVNEKTEQKNGLTYLSWAWAWAEFKKHFPNAEYQVWKDEQGRPYVYDENLGYMVYTRVTVDDLTHEMWLPVMDGANNAMKDKPYEIQRGYKTITVKPASMMDINKTIMRCLTKNLAMFGLGLYIYAGEDLPEEETAEKPAEKPIKNTKPKITAEQQKHLCDLVTELKGVKQGCAEYLAKQMKLKLLSDATQEMYEITRDYLLGEIERKNREAEKANA